MQVEGKRDGATPDIAAGLNGREVDIAAASKKNAVQMAAQLH